MFAPALQAHRRLLLAALLSAALFPWLNPAPANASTPMPADEIIAGEFLGPGVTCPQLRLNSGEQISLSGGDFRQTAQGTRLKLGGSFVRMSQCMQGCSFVVTAFEPEGALSGN